MTWGLAGGAGALLDSNVHRAELAQEAERLFGFGTMPGHAMEWAWLLLNIAAHAADDGEMFHCATQSFAGAPVATVWDGKPDLYHAYQATLGARLTRPCGIAVAARHGAIRAVQERNP